MYHVHPVKVAAAQLSAPDGGFGWVIVLGTFLVHFVADGVTCSYGALMPVLLDVFNEGESTTSAAGSTLAAVTLCVGPIAGALVNKYGCRIVACVGGVVAAVGAVISIFSPNMAFMTVFFGLVTGFGLGLVYLPAIVSVTQWFESKRSFATGIAVCGSGFGTFMFGPLTAVLVSKYDWNGFLLIIAAVLFNCCVFGALFRPVEYHGAVVVPHKNVVEIPPTPDTTIAKYGERHQNLLARGLTDLASTNRCLVATLGQILHDSWLYAMVFGGLPKHCPPGEGHLQSIGNRSLGDGNTKPHVQQVSPTLNFPPVPGVPKQNHVVHISQSWTSRQQDPPEEEILHKKSGGSRLQLATIDHQGTDVDIHIHMSSPFVRKDVLYTNSLSNMALFREDREMYKASVLDLTKAVVKDAMTGKHAGVFLTEHGTMAPGKVPWWDKITVVLTEMLDPSLLKDWTYIWFCISNFFSGLAFQVPYIFLPDRAEKQLHVNGSTAAWLLGAIGVGNIIGRIAFGYLSDRPRMNKLWLYNIATMTAGSAMCVSAACTNFVSMAAFAAVFGIFLGAFVTLTPVLVVDLFGLERLTNAFGILLLVKGIAGFIGGPLAGSIKQRTQSYEISFIVFGIIMVASGAMLFLIPCIRKLESSHKRKSSKKVSANRLPVPIGIVQQKDELPADSSVIFF